MVNFVLLLKVYHIFFLGAMREKRKSDYNFHLPGMCDFILLERAMNDVSYLKIEKKTRKRALTDVVFL